METFSALLAICAGNSPASGEFPAQRPVTRSFDVFFDLRVNKRLRKQSWGWWFEMLSWPLWRHCNAHCWWNWSMVIRLNALSVAVTSPRRDFISENEIETGNTWECNGSNYKHVTWWRLYKLMHNLTDPNQVEETTTNGLFKGSLGVTKQCLV